MAHRLALLSAVAFILFVIGCNKKDNPIDSGGNKQDVLMPFAVGNQWAFIDSTFSTSTGAFVRRDSSRLSITGSTSIQYQGASLDVFYWNWVNPRTGVADDWKWLARNESNGHYMYGGRSSKGTYTLGKFLSEKFPVTAGETWQSVRVISRADSTFAVGDTVQMHCNAVNEQFDTPAGSFKCVVYAYQQIVPISGILTLRETTLYYAPNVGYVGLVGRTNGVRDFKKTLTSYKLN